MKTLVLSFLCALVISSDFAYSDSSKIPGYMGSDRIFTAERPDPFDPEKITEVYFADDFVSHTSPSTISYIIHDGKRVGIGNEFFSACLSQHVVGPSAHLQLPDGCQFLIRGEFLRGFNYDFVKNYVCSNRGCINYDDFEIVDRDDGTEYPLDFD